jgi:hypothetical protein
MVHYTTDTDNDRTPQAAIITAVKLHDQFYQGQPKPDSEENKYSVWLHVFLKSGQFNTEAAWSSEPKPGHWHWPPRV